MSSNPPPKKLTFEEILSKFPAVMSLVNSIQTELASAQVDGKLSGEELGKVLAVAGPPLGKLVDEIVADLND